MKNAQQEGNVLTLTAPSGGVVSGTPVKIGGMLVMPLASVAETLSFAGAVQGVFSGVAKATGTAWVEGDLLYWDNSAFKFTETGTGNIPCAFAVVAAASGDTTGTVLLCPTVQPVAS